MKRLLVCEDEDTIREFVVINLKRAGYDVVDVSSGEAALRVFEQENGNFDIALLDIMMPGIDGITVLKRLREKSKTLGIIMLSAKSQEMDKVNALMNEADDYITKPYNPMELTARVRSSLRRYMQLGDIGSINKTDVIKIGGLELDKSAKQLTVDGEPVRLTATELKILELLMENAGRVFSAEDIYRRVWNEDAYAVENTVMVHIRHIREKIEIDPKEPRYLKVVWGIGYKIEKIKQTIS